MHQLEPYADREDPAHQSGEQREYEVHRADALVVGRIEVPPPTVRVVLLVLAVSFSHRSHELRSFELSPGLQPLHRSRTHCGSGCAAATALDGGASSRANFFLASSTQAENACSLTTRTAIGMKA